MRTGRSLLGVRRAGLAERDFRSNVPPLPKWLQVPSRAWEIAAVAVILAVAAELRLIHLDSMPSGVSPDEAVAGLEARRILEEGWIGPYSPHAAGQPTGVLYVMAASVRLLGETVFSLRLVSAAAGILTVLMLYIVLRRNVGLWPGLIGSGLLAVMSWHVHFGRFAVPVGTWPLVVVATTLLLMEGIRRGGLWWWGVAGAVAGLGVYVYDAHTLFLLILALFLVVHATSSTLPLKSHIVRFAVLGLALCAVALPMIEFAADARKGYFQHARSTSVLNQEAWRALAGPEERVAFLAGRYVGFWDRVCCHPEIDVIDGTGGAALASPGLLLLAATGLVLGLRRGRQPLLVFGALVVVLMPLASVATEGGLARRSLVIVPFIAMFAAIGVVELFRASRARAAWVRRSTGLALAVLAALIVATNVSYFRQFPGSEQERFAFAWAVTDASRFMRGLDRGTHVYFYSNAVSVDYEIRRFVAPDVSGEDRSSEFGRVSYAIDRGSKRPVFVLLGSYVNRLGDVQRRYPGGRTVVGRRGDAATFVAYVPPRRVPA